MVHKNSKKLNFSIVNYLKDGRINAKQSAYLYKNKKLGGSYEK